jgi:hypothetical protein
LPDKGFLRLKKKKNHQSVVLKKQKKWSDRVTPKSSGCYGYCIHMTVGKLSLKIKQPSGKHMFTIKNSEEYATAKMLFVILKR